MDPAQFERQVMHGKMTIQNSLRSFLDGCFLFICISSGDLKNVFREDIKKKDI